MSEKEVEKASETGKKEAEGEQQSPSPAAAETPEVSEAAGKESPAPSAAKTPKVSKAAASESPQVKAKEVKKTAAIEGIMTSIKNMTVLELADLVKSLEAEFGVTAAAPMAAATAAAPAGAEAPSAEEKTEFNVILKEVGANKISVIKAVREVTSLGLKESKDLVESAPKAVREGVGKDEAASIKQKLEAAGATAEVT